MINRISIKNFKSIQSADITFGRFNVVVGFNAAGKTNLLSALTLLRSLAMGRSARRAAENFALIPRELLNKFADSSSFSVDIELCDGNGRKYLLETTFELSDSDMEVSKIFIAGEKLSVIEDSGTKNLIYERKQGKIYNSEEKTIPLDIEKEFLVLSQYADPDARAARRILQKTFITDNLMIDSRESFVTENSSNLGGLLVRLKQDKEALDQFDKVANKLVPSFSSFLDSVMSNDSTQETEDPENQREYAIFIKEKNLKGSLSLSALSTGDIRTLYIIAAAFSLKTNATLVIEEIENGIHPKRVIDVMDYLETISRSREIQIICTSHSPKVINSVRATEVIYALKKDGEGTKFTALKDTSAQTVIQNILNEGGELTDYLNSGI